MIFDQIVLQFMMLVTDKIRLSYLCAVKSVPSPTALGYKAFINVHTRAHRALFGK